MTTAAWTEPQAFTAKTRILSAARLNTMLTNIDVLQGLDLSANFPCEASKTDSHYTIAQDQVQSNQLLNSGNVRDFRCIWRGWVIWKGNRIVVKVGNDAGGVNAASVTVKVGGSTVASAADPNTVGTALVADANGTAIYVAGKTQWQPYEISIHSYDESAPPPIVHYVYMAGDVPTIGAMPAFTDGGDSDLDHFNAIITGTRTLYNQGTLPVAGMFGMRPERENSQFRLPDMSLLYDGTGKAINTFCEVRRFYVQHRMNAIRVHSCINAGVYSVGVGYGYDTYAVGFRILINGTEVYSRWRAAYANDQLKGIYKEEIVNIDSLSLTDGTWYQMRIEGAQAAGIANDAAAENRTIYSVENFQATAGTPANKFCTIHNNATIDDRNGYLQFQLAYQRQSGALSGWTATERWEHGDWGQGSAGTGPRLDTMSDNLTTLDTRRQAIGAVHIAQREPSTSVTPTLPCLARFREFWHIRVHRFLAYKSWYDATSEDDEDTTTKAYLYYPTGDTDGPWGSVELPDINKLRYLDLDTTPVKEGMTFYVVGARYAIQTPVAGQNE